MSEECPLVVYNGSNDQIIQINGLVDQTGTAVTGATITGVLNRANSSLPSGSLSFTDVSGQAGNYSGTLSGFNSATGPATLVITGVQGGVHFGFSVDVSVKSRTL